eukprot:52501-Eustigmatos_ZCMA.PRE.1
MTGRTFARVGGFGYLATVRQGSNTRIYTVRSTAPLYISHMHRVAVLIAWQGWDFIAKDAEQGGRLVCLVTGCTDHYMAGTASERCGNSINSYVARHPLTHKDKKGLSTLRGYVRGNVASRKAVRVWGCGGDGAGAVWP